MAAADEDQDEETKKMLADTNMENYGGKDIVINKKLLLTNKKSGMVLVRIGVSKFGELINFVLNTYLQKNMVHFTLEILILF